MLLTLCVMDLLSKARLLYHLFDDDRSGKISCQELAQVLGNAEDDKVWLELVK